MGFNTLYLHQSGVTFTSNKPNDNSKINFVSKELGNDRETMNASKCAFTTDSEHYFILKSAKIGYLRAGNDGFIDGELQSRLFGETFKNILPVSRGCAGNIFQNNFPLLFVKPNSDIRLVGQPNRTGGAIIGEIEGFLAKII